MIKMRELDYVDRGQGRSHKIRKRLRNESKRNSVYAIKKDHVRIDANQCFLYPVTWHVLAH